MDNLGELGRFIAYLLRKWSLQNGSGNWHTPSTGSYAGKASCYRQSERKPKIAAAKSVFPIGESMRHGHCQWHTNLNYALACRQAAVDCVLVAAVDGERRLECLARDLAGSGRLTKMFRGARRAARDRGRCSTFVNAVTLIGA